MRRVARMHSHARICRSPAHTNVINAMLPPRSRAIKRQVTNLCCSNVYGTIRPVVNALRRHRAGLPRRFPVPPGVAAHRTGCGAAQAATVATGAAMGVARRRRVASSLPRPEPEPTPWLNQDPPAEDVVVVLRPNGNGAGYIEVDRLADGTYRATHGSAFGCIGITRTRDPEGLLRQLNKALWCQADVGYQAVVRRLRAESLRRGLLRAAR